MSDAGLADSAWTSSLDLWSWKPFCLRRWLAVGSGSGVGGFRGPPACWGGGSGFVWAVSAGLLFVGAGGRVLRLVVRWWGASWVPLLPRLPYGIINASNSQGRSYVSKASERLKMPHSPVEDAIGFSFFCACESPNAETQATIELIVRQAKSIHIIYKYIYT